MFSRNCCFFVLLLFVVFCGFSCQIGNGQSGNTTIPDPLRFAEEMERIKVIRFDEQKDRIVFTGSSSIRFWKDIFSYYPENQIINTGFGGSEMSDLLYYLEETVLRFAPSKVFIYEGDNDVNSNRSLEHIMMQTKEVVEKIEQKIPNCQIILIAAKPSIARWHLKKQYKALNERFQTFAAQKDNRHCADIWDVMLDEKGEVLPAIFIEDGLHMNQAGYKLWDEVIEKFVAM